MSNTPYPLEMSMLYVMKAASLSCPNKLECNTCEYEKFCGAVQEAFQEAIKHKKIAEKIESIILYGEKQ